AAMDQPHARRHQTVAGELPADADQRGHEEFDLMAVEVPAHPDVVERDRDLSVISVRQGYAFIDDRAVACRPPQSLAQRVRGCGHVVEQSDLSQLERLGEMEPEKIELLYYVSEIGRAHV